MSMGFSGIRTPGSQGSSRIIDIAHDPSSVQSDFGPSQVLGAVSPRSITQNAISRGPWNGPNSGLSGANKDRHGGVFEFLGASSFNVGIFANFAIPIVGRGPSPNVKVVEEQDYWAMEIMLGQGEGLAHGGFSPSNPPWSAPLVDVGVFFFIQDYNLSASAYGGFTDLDGSGGCAGFGLFVGQDGKWHYGVRITRSGSATPLDVDVALNFDPTNAQAWPELAINADKMVRTKWEWFAGKNGQKPIFQLTLGNNPPLVKTTIADIGTTPVANGLATELPDAFSQSDQTYGWVGCVRAGDGQNKGNASGTMTLGANANPGDQTLTLAITSPGGDFAPGDKLVVGGQTFFVTGTVLIPAAASVVVPVRPPVGVLIASGTSVAYTQEPQTFGIKMLAHLVAGPAIATTVLA